MYEFRTSGAGSLSLSDISPCLSISKWWQMAVNGITYAIPFCVVSITKYDDLLKGPCHGTIDFLA